MIRIVLTNGTVATASRLCEELETMEQVMGQTIPVEIIDPDGSWGGEILIGCETCSDVTLTASIDPEQSDC